jgi:hypothetical protein
MRYLISTVKLFIPATVRQLRFLQLFEKYFYREEDRDITRTTG